MNAYCDFVNAARPCNERNDNKLFHDVKNSITSVICRVATNDSLVLIFEEKG